METEATELGDLPMLPDVASLSGEITRLDAEIAVLELAADPSEAERLHLRLNELRATAWVALWRAELLGEVDRLRTLDSYGAAIATCDTHPITLVSNQLTQRYVCER